VLNLPEIGRRLKSAIFKVISAADTSAASGALLGSSTCLVTRVLLKNSELFFFFAIELNLVTSWIN
jgi:hypothetical protein